MKNNFVAKNLNKFNRPSVHLDRTKVDNSLVEINEGLKEFEEDHYDRFKQKSDKIQTDSSEEV